jgi:hypothetical protein
MDRYTVLVKGMKLSIENQERQDMNLEDVLRFQADRLVKQLFKTFLVVMEDLAEDHDSALQKIEDALPDQYKPYVKLGDYFDEAKADRIRNKILDAGNDCLRELDKQISYYDISFKKPNK